MAMLFAAGALFSLRRAVGCMALGGIFVAMMAGGIFPFNMIFDLPLIGLIRNAHFLLQFLVFIVIMLSAFGFDYFQKKQPGFVFPGLIIIMLAAALLVLRNGNVNDTTFLYISLILLVRPSLLS